MSVKTILERISTKTGSLDSQLGTLKIATTSAHSTVPVKEGKKIKRSLDP